MREAAPSVPLFALGVEALNLRSVLDLAGVLRLVVMALRLGEEPVGADRPLLVAADPDAITRAAGTRVGADEGSVVLAPGVAGADVVQKHLQVGESLHERARGFGDRSAADRGTPPLIVSEPSGA